MGLQMIITGHGYKISRIIIGRIAINMMNMFSRCKETAIMILPDQPMLKNITRFVSQVAIWHKNKPITFPVFLAASFPAMRLLAFRIMTMDISDWISFILSTGKRSNFSNRSFSSTATFAKTTWLKISRWINPPCFLGSLEGWGMSLQVFRKAILVVRLPWYFLAAAAIAYIHKPIVLCGL